ncbi:MAG TPA: hypothetical protein VJA21_29235, partial [Verrucomicrobiae bacterium]
MSPQSPLPQVSHEYRLSLGSIGSGAEDCASAPSHTTGRAVFRIQRLNAAASFMVRRGQMEPQ